MTKKSELHSLVYNFLVKENKKKLAELLQYELKREGITVNKKTSQDLEEILLDYQRLKNQGIIILIEVIRKSKNSVRINIWFSDVPESFGKNIIYDNI